MCFLRFKVYPLEREHTYIHNHTYRVKTFFTLETFYREYISVVSLIYSKVNRRFPIDTSLTAVENESYDALLTLTCYQNKSRCTVFLLQNQSDDDQ